MSTIRQTWRRLWRAPGSTLAATACVALGVGTASAILAMIYVVLLKPLPYPRPKELTTVWEVSPQPGQGGLNTYLSVETYLHLRRESRAFKAVAAYNLEPVVLTGRGEPLRLSSAAATPELFTEVLGVSAAQGRLLQASDEKGAAVVLLSHALWRRAFGSDPKVVGRTIVLDDRPHTVVGVLPASFRFENPEPEMLDKVDLWRPLVVEDYRQYGSGLRFLRCLGRLRRDVALARAREEMAVLSRSLGEQLPQSHAGWGLALEPLHEQLVGHVRPELAILLGAVGLVFLIAAGNLANLLLLRAIHRSGEMAVRTALGAGRGRIFQQLLGESLMVCVLGGILGLFFGLWITRVLVALSPVELPRLGDADLVPGVVLAALAGSVLAALLCVMPATATTGRRFSMELLRRAEGGSEARSNVRLRNALVLAELAMAMTLLSSGGLLLNSFWRLTNVDLGFSPRGVLVMRLDLPWSRYSEPHRILGFYEQLSERVAALPEVEAVGLAKDLPLTGEETRLPIRTMPPSEALSREKITVAARIVSAGYFRALGERLADGRVFDDKQTRGGGVVLNRELARLLWPAESPIGKTVTVNWFGKTVGGPVVGIVEDIRQGGADAAAEPAVYIRLVDLPYPTLDLVVRTRDNPLRLAAPVRGVISALDRNLPVDRIEPMTQILARATARQRFLTLLVMAFAVIAVLLAVIGLYGIVSFTVQKSARQVAIRLALGSLPGAEVARVVRRTGLLLAGGLAVGLALVVATRDVLARFLFEVAPTDPVTLISAIAIFSAITLLAAYLPARRLTRLDTVTSLRQE